MSSAGQLLPVWVGHGYAGSVFDTKRKVKVFLMKELKMYFGD